MRGNVRYDIAPPPPPRRLTTARRSPQPRMSDHDLKGHWIGITIFGLLWVAIGRAVGRAQRGGEGAPTGTLPAMYLSANSFE
eukprot:5768439-Pyramimonas_sp.AAC.1